MVFSPFQVEEYHIVRIHADMSIVTEPVKIESQYYAQASSEYSDGKWRGDVGIGFRYIKTEDEQGIIAEIVINGKFSMAGQNDDIGKEMFENRLKINGASTLIPIARAALASTSAIMGYPNKLTLPNINVKSMKWKEAEEEA